MKKFAFLALVAAIFVAGGVAKTIDDKSMGFRSDLMNDDTKSVKVEWDKKAAGESQMIERSFENAPPMISHDIEDFIPIKADNNACLSCHLPEFAAGLNATPVPKTHLMNMASGKDLGGALSQERFNCTQCHVTQANVKPLVKNNFKAEFRQKDGKNKSNLSDVMLQGAEK